MLTINETVVAIEQHPRAIVIARWDAPQKRVQLSLCSSKGRAFEYVRDGIATCMLTSGYKHLILSRHSRVPLDDYNHSVRLAVRTLACLERERATYRPLEILKRAEELDAAQRTLYLTNAQFRVLERQYQSAQVEAQTRFDAEIAQLVADTRGLPL